MGGFYLDDFAVWVRTQKGSILRGVICGALILATGLVCWRAFSIQDDLDAVLASQVDQMAQDEYDLNRLIEQRAEIVRTQGHDMFTPAEDGGEPIAWLQSKYNGWNQDIGDVLPQRMAAVKNGDASASNPTEQAGLLSYVNSENLCNPWFTNPYAGARWSCASTQTVVTDNVNQVPAVFVCRPSNSSLDTCYGIATCMFDLATGKLSSADVYTTYTGQKLVAAGRSVASMTVDTTPADVLGYDKYNRDQLAWRLRDAGLDADPAASADPSAAPGPDTNGPPVGTVEVVDPETGVGSQPPEVSQAPGGFNINDILGGFGN